MLINQCFPDNLVTACFERKTTEITKVESDPRVNETDNSTYTVMLDKYGLKRDSGTNVLGIVVFSIALGVVLNHLGEEGEPLKKFFKSLNSATMILINVVICSATLPLTMDCLVNKNKVNLNVVRFVAPVGATINMDGTALYEAVACIFIAQINGMNLSVADVIVVSLTATAAAIGAAGVPQAGLVTLVIVLTAVGLPTEDVTFILSIDWFLDRFRTAINVWGDSTDSLEVNIETDDHKSNGDQPPSYNGVANEAFDKTDSDTKL
ncbi:amino acid transporter [Elysia marginata]|uniref:Amino acid transporter n=1 Tax=Elysia marginata TaxID=1093978 RepID=A0AAV4F1C7_9GAST|nr:amino acid transporter [Elysia marginata]